MYHFSNENLTTVISILKNEISKLQPKEIYEFEVLNPDIEDSVYNGTIFEIEGKPYIYRELRSWIDLADSLYCKALLPEKKSKNIITIRFEKLDLEGSFHKSKLSKEEKYGSSSIFWQIDKNETPSFLYYYIQSLENSNINERKRILNLGVNNGDEFEVIKQLSSNFERHEIVGIDFCQSAVDEARKRFKDDDNISFYQHDINDLDDLDLGQFDLIITIGTLQSSNLNFKPLFMDIVQKYLKKEGSMIMGFPNCRWLDGTFIFGANAKNYNFPEYSVLYNDVVFCKKYLQQKKYRVTVTGKNYIFLTATSIQKNYKS
jgi:SAM-dependent methyltransferase